MTNYTTINRCRICGNSELIPILDLGMQTLTGVFPKSTGRLITKGPLELVKCQEDVKENNCGLLQLKHSFNSSEMYGKDYGYRSGLNQSMVNHLHSKVQEILNIVEISFSDFILDIGSNDSTTLQAYPEGLNLVGMDPTGVKFKKYYPRHIQLISDFFSAKKFQSAFPDKKAKIITSISMFYDLETPLEFVKDINKILAEDGIWVFEQSYMPTMLEKTLYDTVCHEHLEYYRLKQIKWMLDQVQMKIIDVKLNDINGGSFSVIAAKGTSPYSQNTKNIERLLEYEKKLGLHTDGPYIEFREKVFSHRDSLLEVLRTLKKDRKTILGYGASTKGNVILQFCGISSEDIPSIAEVNSDKFGCLTPGTHIPIISEEDAKSMNPDYFLVLPWHFKKNIILREKYFLENGGKLLMPLPKPEVISIKNSGL